MVDALSCSASGARQPALIERLQVDEASQIYYYICLRLPTFSTRMRRALPVHDWGPTLNMVRYCPC